jgi:TetR/AcrR family transcriptional regulator, transcriptional repressor for nem operon
MSTATATTKERILDAAEEIMLQKSFHSVGLNEILTAVKVPKGSFYHYFQSKEQFGVELLRHYVKEASAFKRRLLLGTEVEADPLKRLGAFLDCCISKAYENSCKCSCLVVKLATEVTAFSDGMRETLADGMREWRGIFERLIAEGQAKGTIRSDIEAAFSSAWIQDLWTGATHRSQIERSVEPLRTAKTVILNYLTPR